MSETTGSNEDVADSPLIEYAEYCFNVSTATAEEKGWDSSVPFSKHDCCTYIVQMLMKPLDG